jgi:hypothetical protein
MSMSTLDIYVSMLHVCGHMNMDTETKLDMDMDIDTNTGHGHGRRASDHRRQTVIELVPVS